MTIQMVPTESERCKIPTKYLDVTASRREMIKISEEFRWEIQQLVEKAQHKLQIVSDRILDYEKYLMAYHMVRMQNFLRKKKKERIRKIKLLNKEIKLAKKLNKPIKLKRLLKQLEKVKETRL